MYFVDALITGAAIVVVVDIYDLCFCVVMFSVYAIVVVIEVLHMIAVDIFVILIAFATIVVVI